MTRYFISRHPGAVEWLRRRGHEVDVRIEHLQDVAVLQPGDQVYGTLPINWVAAACARGARYWHLILPQSLMQRGKDMTAEEMEAAGATLAEFEARAVPTGDGDVDSSG